MQHGDFKVKRRPGIPAMLENMIIVSRARTLHRKVSSGIAHPRVDLDHPVVRFKSTRVRVISYAVTVEYRKIEKIEETAARLNSSFIVSANLRNIHEMVKGKWSQRRSNEANRSLAELNATIDLTEI